MRKGIRLPIDPEIAQNIIDEYIDGVANHTLGKKYKLPGAGITRLLKEYGVHIRTVSESKTLHKVNSRFFETIDTPTKAYFLGLMYADGHNNVKRHQIVLNLHEKDVEIIERFKKEIRYTGNISTWKRQPPRGNIKALSIVSTKLSQDLLKLGCTQQKTEVLNYPYWMNNELQLHFIRGFFDGDGTISRTGKYTVAMSFIAIKDMAEGISQYLNKIIEKSVPVAKWTEGKYTIDDLRSVRVAGKKDIKKIMDLWYKDTDLYLRRKYDRYYQYFYIDKLADYELYTSNGHTGKNAGGGNSVSQYDLNGEILGSWNTMTEAALQTEVPISYIIGMCKKYEKDKELKNVWSKNVDRWLIWCYQKDVEKYAKPTITPIKRKERGIRKMKNIIQYTVNGEQVREWESSSDAKIEGYDPSAIVKVCKGKLIQYKGYKWQYK